MRFPLPLILDGATGSALQKRGMPAGVCTERWILENPAELISLQSGYVRSGAQALYAPTFGCNRPTLQKFGLGDFVRDYCLRLIELSRTAAAPDTLIGGDLSPTGLFMEPLGDHSFEDIAEIYAEQAATLAESGVDFFAVETQLSLDEAKAAVTGIRSVSDKPILVTFSCNNVGLSFFGESLPDAAAELSDMGVDAFGINCCGDLALLTDILSKIHEKCPLPLVAKPNAGSPKIIDGTLVYDMTPEELAAQVPALYAAGARLIGGCCGTGDAHIAAVAAELKRLA